jgi:hypothetical protein
MYPNLHIIVGNNELAVKDAEIAALEVEIAAAKNKRIAELTTKDAETEQT